jgi:hypothetical protein
MLFVVAVVVVLVQLVLVLPLSIHLFCAALLNVEVAVQAVEAEVTLATLAVRGGGGVLAQQPIQLHSIAYRSRRVLQHQSQSHLPEGRSSFPGILSSRKTGWQRENSSKFSRLGG